MHLGKELEIKDIGNLEGEYKYLTQTMESLSPKRSNFLISQTK